MKKIHLILLLTLVLLVSYIFLRSKTISEPLLTNTPYVLEGTQLPKGDRMLGIDVNIASDNDYDKAFKAAKSLGMEVIPLSINWNDVEKTKSEYNMEEDFLAIADAYYPPTKTKLALYIRSVDTNSKPVPKDLEEVPFDDPKMTERYLKMIDWVFSKLLNTEIVFLSVGDEIDLMIGDDKALYRQFEIFFRDVKEKIKEKNPNLKVGFTATLYGLTERVPEELKRINEYSDVVFVSYYPVKDDIGLKDPSVVSKEIDSLIDNYPNKIIYIEQTGYPTSSYLNGSEAKQREFIREIFKAWDKHSSQIKYISFTWLNDLSASGVHGFNQYYGWSDKSFNEFIRTLGFRTYDGQDKEAYRAIKAEANARGW